MINRLIKTLISVAVGMSMVLSVAPMTFASDSDYVGIEIDGNYDDWEDKPTTQIQYPWDTGNNYHLGSLFRDEEYCYLHIKMSDRSYTQFNGYSYYFIVDGVQYAVCVVPPEGSQITTGDNPVIVRNQNGYQIIDNGVGYVSRQDGRGDEWELKIPLSFFSSNPDTIKEIEFYSPNIGPQHLIATGTPTYAAAVVVSGAVLAISAYALMLNKKKKAK